MDERVDKSDAASGGHPTYVAGEDASRLATAAADFGLSTARRPVDHKAWFSDAAGGSAMTLMSARMHSVGALGKDERVDEVGHLHLITIRKRSVRRDAMPKKQPQVDLMDLFAKDGKPPPMTVEEGTEGSEEEIPFEIEGGDEMVSVEEIEDVVEGGSLRAAVFGIIKGTVGPAILFLPRGFIVSGYGVAIPAMIFATAMYIFNAHRLLECWKVESEHNRKVAERIDEVRALLDLNDGKGGGEGYGSAETGGEKPADEFKSKMLTYPELARLGLPSSLAFSVRIGIALFQFGVCLTYLIYIPQNLTEVALSLLGPDAAPSKEFITNIFLILTVLIEIPLGWIRDIRKLTHTNVLATVLIAYGLLSVIFIAIMNGLKMVPLEESDGEAPSEFDDGSASGSGGEQLAFFYNFSRMPFKTDAWFIFVGTSFYMMEGAITLLVPLQEAVYAEEDRAKFPLVNQITTSWIVVFYIIFSMVCCTAFGSEVQTALTASLPAGILATTVQLGYSIAILFTYPLQAFPAAEVTCTAVLGIPGMGKEEERWVFKRNVFMTIMNILFGVIAVYAKDSLGNVASILGSMFGIPLALIFPPLIHNNLVLDKGLSTSGLSTGTSKFLNYCVLGAGFFATFAGSFATIVNWNKGADG